ncbi:unnamed protein product, partial [Meganyctiphanes norvegica]
ETSEAGPQEELEYWKLRMAKLKYLSEKMNSPHVLGLLIVLQLSRSKIFKSWKEADHQVTQYLDEAKDNVKYVYAIEEYCHPLYLNEPASMTPHILMLFNKIRMIYKFSKYY